MTQKCIIVAVADNMAIGVGNQMPWHIPDDLRYFRETTLGCPVIMGRRTFLSIGSKPLPGRRNIILSRGMTSEPGIEVAGSLNEAYEMVSDAAKCFVIGGASVYAEAIGTVDKLYITRVHTDVRNADAFFPGIDPELWVRESLSETHTSNGIDFEFEVYSRR